MAGRPDPEVLEYAARHGLILVSHDLNTMPAHATQRIATRQALTGLLMVRQTLPLSTAIEQLLLIWSASDAEEWKGLITFLPI